MVSNPVSNPSISILFVEDDEIVLNIQASIITEKFPDIVIHTAVNANLGLMLFKTHSPDIVITDINMSDMDGVQMTDNIRTIKPNTKFIAITGKSLDINRVDFDHYIVKPLIIQELFTAIEQCIDEITQQTDPNITF